MAKIRVFVDSNVWFSAFYKKGLPSKLIEKLSQKKFEVVISQLVLEEIVKNIEKKLPHALPLVYQFFQTYPLTVLKNPVKKELKSFEKLAEKKDLPILVAAINYRCRFLITGNVKDFKIDRLDKKYNLKILTPGKAIKIFHF